MKVALVITNLAGGGAELAMLRLAAALDARGHSVRMLLLDHRVEHAIPPGVDIVPLAGPGARATRGLLGKWLGARRLAAAYRRLGLAGDCLTISTLPFADEIAARAGLPNLWFRIANTLSAEVEQLRLSQPARARRRLARYRRLYEGRNLVAVSDGVAQDLRGAVSLVRARIVRIYNGFDFAAIQQAAAQPARELPAEPFVLHVGRFMPQKRHDVLLDAWRLAGLPYRLVLLSAASPALEAMIRERALQDRVTVAGFQPNPYPWMRAAELLTLCSDREGMPNVLVEALACGTRVLSTDCPSGPREVLRGDLARFLVPRADPQALARGMRAALLAPRPTPAQIPAEFSLGHMAERYEALAAMPSSEPPA
jgi:glycosyltransferase involved in cell wall biosynthesis